MNKKKNRKMFKKLFWERRATKIRDKNGTYNHKVHHGSRRGRSDYKQSYDIIPLFESKGFMKKIHHNLNARIKVPVIFCLARNPDESIEFLRELAYLLTSRKVHKVFIDYSKNRILGLSGSVMLDILLIESESNRRIDKYRHNVGYEISGNMSKNPSSRNLMRANGILKRLGLQSEIDETLCTLDFIIGKGKDVLKHDPSSKVLKYFNSCLAMQKMQFTPEGMDYFSDVITETIDNCAIHPGAGSKWYVLGFYEQFVNDGMCHLVFVSIGSTIYEALKNNSTVDTTTELVGMTKKNNKYFNNNYNEESLWTLLSLQHGVSRKRIKNDPQLNSRGRGTVSMMSGIQSISGTFGEKPPTLSLISGNTQVIFDFDKYPLEIIDVEGDDMVILPLNNDKSLYSPPDSNNLKKINEYFPGTIISMEFSLNKSYITTKQQNLVRRQ